VPEHILETARWWAEFQPGTKRKNLLEVHPEPSIVPATADADVALTKLQRLADDEYDKAHERNDEVSRVAWSRRCENAKKLALIAACRVNHEQPIIFRNLFLDSIGTVFGEDRDIAAKTTPPQSWNVKPATRR